MAGLLSVFAEFEREIIRERVKAGIAVGQRKRKTAWSPSDSNDEICGSKETEKEGIK